MTGSGFRLEELSEPLLRADLRRVRDDMEKLIDRYGALTAEFDRRHGNGGGTAKTTEVPMLADLVKLDDSALIAWRKQTRAELDHNPDQALQALYDATTQEMASRTGEKRTNGGGVA